MVDVILAAGRDRSVRRRHPWIWSGAVERIDGEAAPGACVAVRSSAGELLGHGHYAPDRALRIRMLSFGKDVADDDWLEGILHPLHTDRVVVRIEHQRRAASRPCETADHARPPRLGLEACRVETCRDHMSRSHVGDGGLAQGILRLDVDRIQATVQGA